MRDSEIGASAMGVDIRRTKAAVFVLSSMYAGAAGVLTALVFQRTVPDYFSLHLSISYLVMVILGGLGSVGGAIAGAVFVVTLPLLFSRYADSLPFVTGAGGRGLDASTAAQFVYGAVVIVAMIVQPGGLAALAGAVRPLRSRRPAAAAAP